MAKKREPTKRMIFITSIIFSLGYIAFMIYQFKTGVAFGNTTGDPVTYQEHPIIFYFMLVLQGLLPIMLPFAGWAVWWDAKRKDRRDEWLRQKDQQKQNAGTKDKQ